MRLGRAVRMWGDVAVLCAAIFSIHLMFLNVFFTVWLELNDRSTLILVHERCIYLHHVACNCMSQVHHVSPVHERHASRLL